LTDEQDVLRGNTAQVYRYAIRMGKPVGVREVQKALNMSSPRLASYHLEKLEEAGLLKQTPEGFIVNKLVLEDFIKFFRFLIPKYSLYFAFFAVAMVFQVILFKPSEITREYLFATTILVIATAYFGYETVITYLGHAIKKKHTPCL
jgi:DNA-binding transcriptional ArsR family regulator